MKFNTSIEVLKVEERSFTNATNNKEVTYQKVTFIDQEGNVISCTTTEEVMEEIGVDTRLKGEGEFEVTSDQKGQARVKLVDFTR